MSKINLVEDSRTLGQVADVLRDVQWIGIDTEFLRERTYYPLLCLIQIHSELGEWCIDTIRISDLTPFESILENSEICKIFHSCRQDLEALERRFPRPIQNLYDTQLAAGFCGEGDQISYAWLVKEICGIELPKTQTRTDWSARPLSDSQIDYAIDDVRYLGNIRDSLDARLKTLGRNNWHHSECQKILDDMEYIVAPEDAWKRLKGAVKIPPENHQAGRQLAIWREARAQKRDRPREWIIPSGSIVEICMRRPGRLDTLSGIEGVTPGMVRSCGKDILEILEKNPPNPDMPPIWTRHQPMDNEQKSKVRAVMKKLRSIAEDQNISQSLLANRSEIESLILGFRELNILRGWRYQLAGRSIEEMLEL